MKKEDLFSKWLDHNLDETEFEAFKQLDAFNSFQQLDDAAKKYKAPTFNTEQNYTKLQHALASKSKPRKITWRQWMGSVAAILLIALGLYAAFFNTDLTTYRTENAQHMSYVLPDTSEVVLNAGSEIAYDASRWQSKRTLQLKGEAFFKVEKGNTFTVETTQGAIEVLGTEFNVNSRDQYFEVTCFKGLVEVIYKKQKYRLPSGTNLRVFNGHISEFDTGVSIPAWIEHKSVFKSVPYGHVLDELQRQYNIRLNAASIDKNVIFTGSFTHKDLETAVKAITLPLLLNYEIDETTVTLKK